MTQQAHILIVDDDRDIRTLLSRFLQSHGFVASVAASGKEMRAFLTNQHVDLIVLDRVMPGEDGLELCRELQQTTRVPVILLTLLGSENDRIEGFEAGADDYVLKPFNPAELLGRIRAVLRRANDLPRGATASASTVEFLGWVLDRGNRKLLAPDGSPVTLTDGDYELLEVFVDYPQIVLTRDQLLGRTRGKHTGPFDRSMDMRIARLRRKIETGADQAAIIRTLRNKGYVFMPDVKVREE